MKTIFLVLLCFSMPIFAKYDKVTVEQIRSDVDTHQLDALAKKTDAVISTLIDRGISSLRDQEFYDEADKIQGEYNKSYDGFLTRMVGSRGIGDHKPLCDWLASVTLLLRMKLGDEMFVALGLSDLDSINYGIPVVFHPCTFPMDLVQGARIDEYRRHFAKDDTGLQLYGLFPVVVKWTVEGVCLVTTSGIGSFVCAIGARLAECVCGNEIGPKLSDSIYTRQCGG